MSLLALILHHQNNCNPSGRSCVVPIFPHIKRQYTLKISTPMFVLKGCFSELTPFLHHFYMIFEYSRVYGKAYTLRTSFLHPTATEIVLRGCCGGTPMISESSNSETAELQTYAPTAEVKKQPAQFRGFREVQVSTMGSWHPSQANAQVVFKPDECRRCVQAPWLFTCKRPRK